MSTPLKRPATLADVARFARVSTAVVSYVINDGPRPVAPATAERVRQAVQILGYRPNRHAQALMRGSVGILGLIHPGTSNPFFGEFNDVLYRTAAAAGIGLLTATSAGNVKTERQLMESMASRSLDGIIVTTSMVPADVPTLTDPGIPMVFLDCPFPIPGYTTIGPAASDGIRRLVDHLITTHGHRNIGFIAGDTGSADPEDRELGWRQALQTHRLPTGPRIRTSFHLEGGYDGAKHLLDQPDRPTAIVASSDLQATGALHAIHEHGLRIPEDIAVTGFDGTRGTAHTWPPLTVVRQPMQAMAAAAISSFQAEPSHTLYPMELVTRRSCGCPTTAATT